MWIGNSFCNQEILHKKNKNYIYNMTCTTIVCLWLHLNPHEPWTLVLLLISIEIPQQSNVHGDHFVTFWRTMQKLLNLKWFSSLKINYNL